jgi:PKD repeat protein
VAPPGGTASVPVYIQDVSGTSLDVGTPARIQTIQFTANFSNATLIDGCSSSKFPDCNITFRPAGVLATHTPITADFFKGTASLSVTYAYSQSTDPLPFHADATAPGDLIGYLDVVIVPGAANNARIDISLDSGSDSTFLADQTGQVTETNANDLQLVNGFIQVHECNICVFTVPSSGFVGTSVTFLALSICGGETFTWTFGDGSGVDTASGVSVPHTYSGAGSYTWTAESDGGCFRSGQINISTGTPPVCTTCNAIGPSITFVGAPATFLATSCDGEKFNWSFGDVASSSSIPSGTTITHTYSVAGSYTWTTSSASCQKSGRVDVSSSSPPSRRRVGP